VFADAAPSARFVCVGNGDSTYRRELARYARDLGLESVVIWTGTRRDLRAIYNALDLATLLSTRGEGSPNTVAEALACGVPCVATDVGDTAAILGEPELVIANRAPAAVAAAWTRALGASTPALALERRARIKRELALPKMVLATEEALATLLR
jgi:glycosyltransferase involved in cell wall biosynthesis